MIPTQELLEPLFTSLVPISSSKDNDTGGKNSVTEDFPESLYFDEETSGAIDLSDVKFNSLGSKKDVMTLTVSTTSGIVTAVSGSGITVNGSGTGAMSVSGKLSDLMDYLKDPAAMSYTGAKDVFGIGAAALSLTVQAPKKSFDLGSISVDLEDVSDDLVGTSLADALIGEQGRNDIAGRAGNDMLKGLGGADKIYGEAGNDTVSGGTGPDTLDGGAGEDVLYYVDSAAGVVIDLNADANGNQAAAGGDADGDVISGFEHVYSSQFADVVTGDAGKNILFGYGGDDILNGNGGDDVIRGGAGADTLDGGFGADWVRYLGSRDGVTVSLEDGVIGSGGDAEGDVLSGFDNMQGSDHADSLTGDAGNNYILGFAGDDVIDSGNGRDTVRGGAGADTIQGGSGTDTLQYLDSAAGVVVDLRTDSNGMQSASGGDAQGDIISGFEYVFGSDFADVLTGDSGRNYLYGYDGNDSIAGGEGKDVLRGFGGEDSFVFNTALAASNVDRILDFEAGTDTIVLDRAVFDGLEVGLLAPTAFFASDDGIAITADQRILYDSSSGMLSYDSDGVGDAMAEAFAHLTSIPMLSADDFVIV